MPRHRTLTLKKVIAGIDPELLERYFTEKLPDGAKLPPRIIMSPVAVEAFMEDKRNAEAMGLVLEDFKKINDICDKGKNLIVEAYGKFSIEFRADAALENLAMGLFLDHKEAFDYAYARFCYYHASSMMSRHRIPGEFKLTKATQRAFEAAITRWFAGLAKGEECSVAAYDEESTTIILVKHGSYVRTVAYWKERKVDFISFRPASEDILVYDREKQVLGIKATLHKDREEYIRCFCRHIMGDEDLAASAERDAIYTLEPLQNGQFDWGGDERIRKVILAEAVLKLMGGTAPVVKITSKDVQKTLAEDMSGIGLDSGELTYAKLRFIFNGDMKPEKVTFEVAPPCKSDVAQKKHADVIEAFLKAQGVQLM